MKVTQLTTTGEKSVHSTQSNSIYVALKITTCQLIGVNLLRYTYEAIHLARTFCLGFYVYLFCGVCFLFFLNHTNNIQVFRGQGKVQHP